MDAKDFASLFESATQMDELVHGMRESSREFPIDAVRVTDIRKAAGLSQAKFTTLIDVRARCVTGSKGDVSLPARLKRCCVR